MKEEEDVIYLGGNVNNEGRMEREIDRRISACIITWKKLAEFWKHANCSIRTKLNIYNAVIRAKLIYGLEHSHLSKRSKGKISTFQLKGLRQICKITTTYVDREHTNEYVFKKATELA
eukprot:5697720-Lingulodinium_polyedra.AAC.1